MRADPIPDERIAPASPFAPLLNEGLEKRKMFGTCWFKFTAIVAVAAFAFGAAGPAAGQDAKNLRWKLTPGQHLRLRIDQRVEQGAKVNGQPLNTRIDLGLEIDWKVESVTDQGDAQITQTIDRVQASMETSLANRASYDSAEPKRTTAFARAVHKAVSPYLGLKLVQTITPRGEVRASRLEKAPEAAQPPADGLTGQGIEQLLSQAAVVFPEQALRVGDSWRQRIEAPGAPAGAVLDVTYSYAGAQDVEGKSFDRIDVRAVLAAPPEEDGRPSLRITDQQSAGSILFDDSTGRVVSSEMTSSATVETMLGGESVSSTLTSATRLSIAAAD